MTSILRRPLRYRYYYVTILLIVVNVLVFLYGYVAETSGVKVSRQERL